MPKDKKQGPAQNSLYFTVAKIAKQGDKRLVVIPRHLHVLLADFEDRPVAITITRLGSETKMLYKNDAMT